MAINGSSNNMAVQITSEIKLSKNFIKRLILRYPTDFTDFQVKNCHLEFTPSLTLIIR